MQPKKWTFLHDFKGEKRKKVIAAIKESIRNRKKQIAYFDEHLIIPQKKIIIKGNDVLKGTLPIECYYNENKRFAEWLKKVLRW